VDRVIPAGTVAAALLVNVVLGLLAYRQGSVRRSGFAGGLLVGIPIYLFLGWRGFLILAGMFVIGTLLTRLGYARKLARGVAEERGGARGLSHALANAGVPALCAVGAWVLPHPAWLPAFAGALATATMDTAGSEIGPLWGRRTISMRTFRPVPPGTPGAVSLEGTLGGLGAAALLALVGWATGLLGPRDLAPVVGGALAGNLYESLAGSRGLLPHAWLNATNTAVGGAAAAGLARLGGAL
jgi:uncharacterized protein (TIGR00297 family)